MTIPVLGILSGLGTIGQLIRDIRAAITGKEVVDPTKLAEIEAKLTEMETQLLNAQNEINKIEAGHPSIFVAGWRPFVGWVCGIAFAYHFIALPVVSLIIKIYQVNFQPPIFDIQTLVTVLFGMLGLGLYRTLEKKWDVQDKH